MYFCTGFKGAPEAVFPVSSADFASVLISILTAITKVIRKLPIDVRNTSPRETV